MIKHLIIDGSNLFLRAYHTKKKLNKNKIEIGAIQQSIQMIDRLLKHFRPVNMVLVWDVGKSHKRLEVYPEYKANRKPNMDEDEYHNMIWQKDQVKKFFSNLPVRQVGIDGIEADDVIYFLNEKLNHKKVIISNDRDFIQCIGRDTDLFFPNKGKLLTKNNINEFLGYPFQYFLLAKAIIGDKSDNIRGLNGMGEKRTAKLINEGVKNNNMNLPPEFEPIIKINTALMKMGFLLDTKDKKKIVSAYKRESGKTINKISIKHNLIDIGSVDLLKSLDYILAQYKRLGR